MGEKLLILIQTQPRKVIIYLLLGIAAVFVLVTLEHRLTTGSVTISTNRSSNTIEIRGVDDNKAIRVGTGSLQTRLTSGDYVVKVTDKPSSRNKVFHVTARKSAHYTLNMDAFLDVSYVLPLGAASVVADNSTMNYVNLNDHQLYTLKKGHLASLVAQNIYFRDITWLTTQHGIGVSSDDKTVYSITNNAITPIALPFKNPSVLSYALTPNGQLLISNGQKLYKQNQQTGTFNVIYTADSDDLINSVAASDQYSLLRFAPAPGVKGDGDEAESVTLNTQGKLVAKNKGLSAYTAKWSPDGKYLAITNDTGTEILDSHFNQFRRLGDVNVLGMSWLNNTTLIYGVAGNLMSYNYTTTDSIQLANLGATTAVSGTYPNLDRSELYILTDTSDSPYEFKLQSVGLTAATRNVPDYYGTLGIFLPTQTDQCQFSYSNFGQPVLILLSYIDLPTCTDGAKKELESDNLPVSGFTIEGSATRRQRRLTKRNNRTTLGKMLDHHISIGGRNKGLIVR